MGLSNHTGNKTTFITIVGGKFTKRLHDGEDHPDAVERVLGDKSPNAGKVIKELHYNTLDGMITGGLMNTESQYPSFDLYLEDEGEKFTLQISMDSSFFGEVTKRLPNIDPTQKVMFGIGFDKEARGGKGKNFLFIKQDGVSIHMAYTKDNPNGMPPPAEKTVKGKKTLVWVDQENFLYEVAVDFLATIGEPVTEDRPPVSDDDIPADLDEPEEIPF